MRMFEVLFCILVVYREIVFADPKRKCFGCVSILSCEPAMNILRNAANTSPENNDKLIKSLCGFYNNYPKVCCSDFDTTTTPISRSDISSSTTTTSRVTVEPRMQTEDSLFPPIEYDKHKNARLLPESCGEIDGSRIFGGEVAKLYEFPWMALISYNTADDLKFRCAGSVINSRYILTAAHCVIAGGHFKNIAGVRIGEFDINTATDCQGSYLDEICESKLQDIAVEKIIPHQNFSDQLKPVHDDIALLRLMYDIDLTYNNAQPICLPLYPNLQNVNLGAATAVVAGWGTTENTQESSVLMKVEIPILSSHVCSFHHGRDYSDLVPTTFCAGGDKKDSCRGDSGGPLMIEAEYEDTFRLVQYGIVSFGPKTCASKAPGVYTDVTKYVGWILDNIQD